MTTLPAEEVGRTTESAINRHFSLEALILGVLGILPLIAGLFTALILPHVQVDARDKCSRPQDRHDGLNGK